MHVFSKISDVKDNVVTSMAFKGKVYPVVGTSIRWLSQVGDPALPEYGLRVFTIKPGGSVPVHQHEYAQTQVVTAGTLLVQAYDEKGEKVIDEKVQGPGEYMYVSPMSVHGMKNVGKDDVQFFCCICVLGEG